MWAGVLVGHPQKRGTDVVATHPVPAPAAAAFVGDFFGERLGLADLSPVLPEKSAFLSAMLVYAACPLLPPLPVGRPLRKLALLYRFALFVLVETQFGVCCDARG